VFQLVLPLHECVDLAASMPLHSVADSATEPLQSVVDSIADSTAGVALTETS
jgi:hypothetical protein